MLGCVGSITHVGIAQPSIDFHEDYFCHRKGKYTINTQAVCDFQGYFYDVSTPWIMRTELPVAELLSTFIGQLTSEWRAECLADDPRSFPEAEGRRHLA
ncbi:hypothetical protein CHLRE_01g028777v5 [Chlamydomonas reinhardtii]|uniref:DDE Tnp4 domain-containing protein n=1 Tax=Chlamydomonas reinhardtii TaxID=3055 RepID=A0A2K3E6M6_CHLRE|nr:uncharacterized protein CHLRE_01g028777v5 [Chlamydomonas reinhardtii]PNW88423.1 hypothetical protein CHLRE_01g028777v5 [Chlamydomonas reinhardtii]